MEKWLLTYLIATFFCLIFGGKDPKNVVKTKYGVVKGISYVIFFIFLIIIIIILRTILIMLLMNTLEFHLLDLPLVN